MKRIGLFGGTFNPPHIGHLHAADAFYQAASLDKLYIVPTYITPFKTMTALDSPEARLQMTKLCFPAYTVSDMEIRRGTKSYTCETVRELLKAEDVPSLCLYVGSDMFLSFEKWKNASYLFSVCRLYTAAREDGELDALYQASIRYRQTYGADCTVMPVSPLTVSSTSLREHLEHPSPDDSFVKKHLTASVFGYIMENNLYKS